MSGMVGVIASDWGRATLFTTSLTTLRTPVNTSLRWALTSDRILGRNKIVELALDEGAEWLLFIDDDHCFANDLLVRLLERDVPIVGALYMQRMVPFAPVAYDRKGEAGKFMPLQLKDHGPNDMVEVVGLGTGGMLIRSEILHQIPYPWFEHGRTSEDLMFCDKVYELGLGPIYCDLGARMGHLAPSAIWADHEEDGWRVGFNVADNFALKVPISYEVEVTDISPDGDSGGSENGSPGAAIRTPLGDPDIPEDFSFDFHEEASASAEAEKPQVT